MNRKEMNISGLETWKRISAHINGLAVGTTMSSLVEQNIFEILSSGKPLNVRETAEKYSANDGYFSIALRLLVLEGWLTCVGDEQVVLTTAGCTALPYMSGYSLAVKTLCRVAEDLDRLFDSRCESAGSALSNALELIRSGWKIPEGPSDATRRRILLHLDGHIIAPLMFGLSRCPDHLRVLLPEDGAGEYRRFTAQEPLETVCLLMETQGWVSRKDTDEFILTNSGFFALKMAGIYDYPVTYLPTVLAVPELLFGDPMVVSKRGSGGAEAHLDRKEDVRFSGKVYSGELKERFEGMFLPLFDDLPLEEQPECILDTGCGDASMLLQIYRAVEERTARGRSLDTFPLLLAGADYNAAARVEAEKTLGKAGVSCVVINGDINEPGGMVRELSDRGVDPARILHVCKSVIHNRPYIQLSGTLDGKPSSAFPGGYAAPDGSCISPEAIKENLVAFFRRWIPYTAAYGWFVIEAHSVPAVTVFRNIDRTMMTALEATHGYSTQYLVDMDTFYAAARKAGFDLGSSSALGHRLLGHDYMSVGRFVPGGGCPKIET